MAFIGRGALPQEFVETTSSMLLVAPEPQYWHAQMFAGAMAAALAATGGGLGRGGVIGASGAPYGVLNGHQLMLDATTSGAVTVVDELGKVPGHTVRINRPIFANTTYTRTSRTVANGTTISTTPIDVSSEQVSLTLERWAGPYDQTNSRVAPYGLDRFDASMSIHSMASVVGLHLSRDYQRFIDTEIALLFSSGSSTVMAGAEANVENTSTQAGDLPLDTDALLRAALTLRDAKIPTFSSGRYTCVLHPRQILQLSQDPALKDAAQVLPPSNPLLASSYFKTLGGIADIYMSSTLTTATNAQSIKIYRGQMFGPGMVGAGIGMKPEVRESTDDNYGEHAKVIWVMYADAKVLDNTFGIVVSSS